MPLNTYVASVCLANVVISIGATCLYYKLLWALTDSPAFAVQLCGAVQSIMCGGALLALGHISPPQRAAQKRIPLRSWFEVAGWGAALAHGTAPRGTSVCQTRVSDIGHHGVPGTPRP